MELDTSHGTQRITKSMAACILMLSTLTSTRSLRYSGTLSFYSESNLRLFYYSPAPAFDAETASFPVFENSLLRDVGDLELFLGSSYVCINCNNNSNVELDYSLPNWPLWGEGERRLVLLSSVIF